MAETKPWWQNADLMGGVIAPAAGAAISAAGQNAQTNKNQQWNREQAALEAVLLQQQREQQARQATASAQANLHTEGLNDQFRRSGAYLDAAPAGWAQDLEVKNALASALVPAFAQRANALQNLRSGDAGVAAMQGSIPGFDVDLSRFLRGTSEGATAASIGDRERALQQLMQGSGPATSMGALFGNNPAALSQTEQSQVWADDLRQKAQEKDELNKQYVLGALEGNLNQATDWRTKQEAAYEKLKAEEAKKKESGGFWKSLLKIAPAALQFIPGIGTAAGIALSAGLGAASGAADGGLKGALLGGAGGALGGAGGAIAGKVGGNAVQQALVRGGVGAAGGALSGGTAGAVSGGLSGLLAPQPQQQPKVNPTQMSQAYPMFMPQQGQMQPLPGSQPLGSYGMPGTARQYSSLFSGGIDPRLQGRR